MSLSESSTSFKEFWSEKYVWTSHEESKTCMNVLQNFRTQIWLEESKKAGMVEISSKKQYEVLNIEPV